MSESTVLLETRAISKRFGHFQALSNVSVQFRAHELCAIIGPNGAGKSTFFNVLSGAFSPTSGQVLFKGQDISHLPSHEYARRGIAKSFQITTIFKRLSVFENVRVAVQMTSTRFELWKPHASYRKVNEDADALLTRVGLQALRNKTAGDLAHGQQRSLEVAMALAAEPELFLMDEPTAGMSPHETTQMMELVTTLAKERTVVIVEHKMKLVMGICKRLVVLHHGELLAEGSPEAIRNNEQVRRVYLGQNV